MLITEQANCEHVVADMRKYLAINGRDRVDECWDKIWVTTPGAREAFKVLKDCLRAPNSTKPDGITITGDPDTGKSYMLRRFAEENRVPDDVRREYSEHPAVYILAPAQPSFPIVLERILEELGHPGFHNQSSEMIERYTKRMMARCEVKVVIADELFDIKNNPRIQARTVEFTGALKNFINSTGRPFVASGVPELVDLLTSESQLVTRFETTVPLKPMTLKDFIPVLLAYQKQLPLRSPSNFEQDEEIINHLFARSNGYIGRLSRILRRACRLAIETKDERITLRILERVDSQSILTAA